MNAFFEKSWGAFFAAFVGSLMALVLIPLLSLSWQRTYEIYDKSNPPVSAKLATYEIDEEKRLLFKLLVTRHSDCDFLRMQGFSGSNPLEMHPSTVRRIDGEQPIDYPIGITVLSNTWVLYPLHGPELRLQGYYACSGRVVRPIMVETILDLND